MTELSRRHVLQIAGATATTVFAWTDVEARAAADSVLAARTQAAATGQPYAPRFFTAHEYATVVALADLIIPRDERSAGASEAGAPEFIDYIVALQPNRQMAMRGGLAWLDAECQRRFEMPFLGCADADRRRVLDDIAWPARARPELSHGVAFFNAMRDLVAAGFWSSRIGVTDIGYLGNRVAVWDGPPPAVLQKIGIAE